MNAPSLAALTRAQPPWHPYPILAAAGRPRENAANASTNATHDALMRSFAISSSADASTCNGGVRRQRAART